MNTCANEEFKTADKRMNELYQKLMRSTRSEKFKAALRKSQRAWLAYRDSVIPVYYPDPEVQYGSVQPMCTNEILAELTAKRADELQALLTPGENDVCESND